MARASAQMKPTVHLNGTSREELRTRYSRAARGLREAIRAVHESAPFARDYYPQGDRAYLKARGDHEERIKRLVETLEEITDLHDHVENER